MEIPKQLVQVGMCTRGFVQEVGPGQGLEKVGRVVVMALNQCSSDDGGSPSQQRLKKSAPFTFADIHSP